MTVAVRARKPWGEKLVEVLGDGEWHDREAIIGAVAAVVPPGVAYRRGEQARLQLRQADGARTRGEDTTSVATGAREVARKTLNQAVRRKVVERSGELFRWCG